MEFGPRALGSRILGDPRDPQMQSRMNLQIEFRESFRPFARAVLRDRCNDYFALRPDDDRPYMSIVAPVAEARQRPVEMVGRDSTGCAPSAPTCRRVRRGRWKRRPQCTRQTRL